AARRLAEELHRQMLHRGVLCGVLRVSARTSDGETLTRIWRVAGALSASELTDRVRWQVEGWLSGRSGRRRSAPVNHLAHVGGEALNLIRRVAGALSASEVTDRVRWQLESWLSGRSGRRPSAPLNHLALVGEEVSSAAAVQEGLWGRGDRGERQAGRAALRVQ